MHAHGISKGNRYQWPEQIAAQDQAYHQAIDNIPSVQLDF